MRSELKPLLTAALIFAAILCIYTQIIDPAPMMIQEQHNEPIGEIYGDTIVGQSFVATEDQLTRVDVKLATYARENTGDIIFGLREATSTQETVSITVKAEAIKDNAYHSFVFDPILESKGKLYVFTVSALESKPGNAITIWYSTDDVYSNGTAQINDKPIEGDLSFRTYYTYTLLDFTVSFFKKFMRDGLFSLAYIIFIGVISMLIILHLREKRVL